MDRIGGLVREGTVDPGTLERTALISEALESIATSPAVGQGLGAHKRRDGRASHNIYVDHMVQHGLLGILLYPMLVIAMIRGAKGPALDTGLSLAAFLLFWGLFSHNVLGERYLRLAVVVQAALSRQSALGDLRAQAN